MRLTLVGSVIVAMCAVATSWSVTSERATAEECLSAPKGAAPEGRHWYYRSDKSSGKRCWYLAAKGKKARQASAPPRAAQRPDPEPVEAPTISAAPTAAAAPTATAAPTTAAAPTIAAAAESPALPAGAVAPPVAPPGDVVTQFSQQWPHYERPSGTVGRAPETNTVGDTEEMQLASAEAREVPMVQPVRGAEEPAAATAPTAPILNTNQMFILLIGSLCLAGMFMGLICAASSLRTRRRIARTWEPPVAAPWRDSPGTGYRPAEKATGYRSAEQKVSAPVAEQRAADIPRMEELESDLQQLLDGWRRRAA